MSETDNLDEPSCSTSSPGDKDVSKIRLSELLSKYFKDCGSAENKILAKCNNCGSKIKASIQATSNLITHLKRCNPTKYSEYLEDKGRASKTSTKTNQLKMQSFFKAQTSEHFKPKDPKQRQMVKALLFSLASDQLPLSLVDSSTFRGFVLEAEPKFVIPARSSIRNVLLPEYMGKMEATLASELKDLNRLYLTLDLWTNRQMTSFLGVTVHYVNKDWELKSNVLGCDVFENRHTALNIATAYEDIVSRFSIQGKVRKVVADNASSMVKAFDVSLPSFYTKDEAEDEDLRGDLDILDEDISLEDILSFLPQRIGCFAHTQQLCVKDGLTHPDVKTSLLSSTLHKVSSVVNSIRRSTVAAPYLRNRGIVLQTQNVTRWNSQLKMVKSLLKNTAEVNNAVGLLSQKEKKEKHITSMEISALKELITVLEPFQEAMEVVEGQKKVTISAIGPVIQGLKHSLEHLLYSGSSSSSQLQYCEPLARALLDSVKKRLDPYVEMKDIRVAAFLDPRFKLDWLSSPEEKDKVLEDIKEMLDGSEKVHMHKEGSEPEADEGIVKHDQKRPRLFSFIPSSNKPNEQSQGNTTSLILKQYLEEGTVHFSSDPLKFWKNAPTALDPLKNLAKELMGCTATSAPSERVFSIAGNYFTANRSQLGVGTFRSLLMIKCNSDIFKKLPSV